MEVLPADVQEFLETIGLKGDSSTNSFLASNTADLASKYEEWRDKTGKGDVKGTSAKGIVYSWKQDVTRKQRENIRRAGEMTATTSVTAIGEPSASASSLQKGTKGNNSKNDTNNITSMQNPAVVVSQDQEEPSAKKKRIGVRTAGSKSKFLPPVSSSSSTAVTSATTVARAVSMVVKNKKGAPILKTTTVSDPYSGSDTEKNSDEEELIWQVEDHDVLSGRGGATNQHIGNEWYRRLVRCSAGFYRTCPKHTKLMVAKSVVKATKKQDPPGRFLEVDALTGAYKQMSHKRAVDKASQALRERWDRNPADGCLEEIMTELFNSSLKTNRDGSVGRDSIARAVDLAVYRVASEVSKAIDNVQHPGPSRPTQSLWAPRKKAPTKSSKPTSAVAFSNKSVGSILVGSNKMATNAFERPKSSVIRKGGEAYSIIIAPKIASDAATEGSKGSVVLKGEAGGSTSTIRGPNGASAASGPKTTGADKSKSWADRKGGHSKNSSGGPSTASTPGHKATAPKEKSKKLVVPRAAAVPTAGASRDGDKHPNSGASRPIFGGREDSFGSPVPRHFVYPSSTKKKSDAITPATSSFVDLPSSFDTATIASLSPSFDAATESTLSPSFEAAAGLSSHVHDCTDGEGSPVVAKQGVKRKSGPRSKVPSGGGTSTKVASTSVKKSRNNDNSGISPFHREILKMNLQRIID